MRINLVVVGWADFRPWHAKSGDTRGSLAWSNRKAGAIYVRAGMQWLLWGLARLGHELEHVLDSEFGNAGHAAHRGHGCLRSYSFWRSWDHAAHATPELARRLRADGFLEVA